MLAVLLGELSISWSYVDALMFSRRADYGTTKYCSAYLRNETCTNRNCTFLHEAGEENESFTREDLSSLNAKTIQNTSQQPGTPTVPQATPSAQVPTPQLQQPPQTTTQPVVFANITPAQSTERRESIDDNSSPVDSSDGSALPSTVSWANKNSSSRRASQVASLASPSPMVGNSVPVVPEAEVSKPVAAEPVPISQVKEALPTTSVDPEAETAEFGRPTGPITRSISPLSKAIRACLGSTDTLQFHFDETIFSEDPVGRQTLALIHAFPPLFDVNGGAKRRVHQRQEAERRRLEADQHVASQALAAMDMDETMESGSLQLGGEAEERAEFDSRQHIIRPPSQSTVSSAAPGLGPNYMSSANPSALNGRGNPSQQQQQYLLHQLKSASPSLQNQAYNGPATAASVAQPIQSGAHGQGHNRQTSRFSFANDSASASASVKPVANAKLMNQQSSMMPPQHINQFNPLAQPQTGSQFHTSAVQGPPPGLKATGTPPVGGMFGQGHGFATGGPGYGTSMSGRTATDEMMRELLRSRGGSAQSGRASDAGRRKYNAFIFQ